MDQRTSLEIGHWRELHWMSYIHGNGLGFRIFCILDNKLVRIEESTIYVPKNIQVILSSSLPLAPGKTSILDIIPRAEYSLLYSVNWRFTHSTYFPWPQVLLGSKASVPRLGFSISWVSGPSLVARQNQPSGLPHVH